MRIKLTLLATALVLLSTLQLSSQQTGSQGTTIDYARDVQPILSSSCYSCHGGSLVQGQLRLDVRSLALKGGISGAAIAPGNSAQSRLLLRVRGAGDERQMPLGKDPLTPAQIDVLARWIDQGALWPDQPSGESAIVVQKHWAYARVERPSVPAVQNGAWARNPIDRFVLARLEAEGLRPSAEASREALIRRLSLDLIGLPPSPAEVDAFLEDTRPDAYERVVDRLLASSHYGERWATRWLDLARYGDSDGYEKDRQRVAWPYRDWAIEAFNKNIPFDQFAIEQLAGDLLPDATTEQKIATGFVRSSMLNTEAGTDPEEQNWVAQLDRAGTVGTAFLGSTVACAQCHNHKYDPFTQRDFYGLVAFFNNAEFTTRNAGNNAGPSFTEPTLDLATPTQAARRDELNAQIRQLQNQMNAWPEADQLRAVWQRGILNAEETWLPLRPTVLETSSGALLTSSQSGSILASGPTPASDTYTISANVPINGPITALRLEALPHTSLPMNGPGRDYYGNFAIYKIDVEAGASPDKLSPIAIGGTLTDAPSTETNDTVIRVSLRQLWRAQVGGAERLRRQLLLIPEKPFTVEPGGLLRVRIVQTSDVDGQILGHFRLSATTSGNPGQIVDIPYDLRPLLTAGNEVLGDAQPAQEQRQSPQQQLTRQWQSVAPELAATRKQIADLQDQVAALGIPSAPILSENKAVAHPTTFLRVRGDFTNKGEEVQANVPAFLGNLPADVPGNRLGLARWLVSRDNPLTARVRVNHIWQTYFGQGIVETSEDFGSQGARPTHPELLDWLAVEFMERQWDQKAIHRLIVTSSTYRQSSAVTPELLERDPINTLFTRGPRFRVEAEMVRDITLSASGLLSDKIGGPPVMPPQPDGQWVFPFQAANDRWIVSDGADRHRRGIYTFIRRTARYPSLMVFDAPSREYCSARRPETNTPLQALTTLNDPAFFEAAQAMAQRILREGGSDVTARAAYGFRLATSRRPDAQELRALVNAFNRELQYFNQNRTEATNISGQTSFELAAWTMVSNSLLNLDATLTKE